MALVVLTCSICLKEFKQEKRFLEHLKTFHLIEDHFQLYLNLYHNGIHPTCSCNENCNDKLKWYGWKKGFHNQFVRGHNAKIDNVFKNPLKQIEFKNKRVQGYNDKRYSVWNVGLTKATDDRIERSSYKTQTTLQRKYKSGELISWQRNKPVQFEENNKQHSKRMKGNLPWNKGRTKHNDYRLIESGNSISKSMLNSTKQSKTIFHKIHNNVTILLRI